MIIEAHHGDIWAESAATGTQFSLVLPYGNPVSTLKMPSKPIDLRSPAAATSIKKLSA
jgi:hypothetical protein